MISRLLLCLLATSAACQGPRGEPDAPARQALADPIVVTINSNQVFQIIDGFGAAQPGGETLQETCPGQPPEVDQDTTGRLVSFPGKSRVMDLLFKTSYGGIGLTILRMRINPMIQPTRGPYNDDDPWQSWMMQEAAKRGPVKMIAASWSPPAWMKTSGCTTDGRLTEQHYQDYAELLSHFVGPWAAHNQVDIYAISLSNEPDTTFGGGVNWDTCNWTGEEYRKFLRNHLKPTFARDGRRARVISPDLANWNEVDDFMEPVYNDAAAWSRVDIVGAHLYPDSKGKASDAAAPLTTALRAGKHTWVTEHVRANTWTIDEPLDEAKLIHDGLVGANNSAYIWFAAFGGAEGDQVTGSLLGCVAGPVIGCSGDGRVATSRMFWVLGNFSRFIRPGYVRVGATVARPNGSSAALLDASAYKDPNTGRLVIVALNRSTSANQVVFDVPGLVGLMTPFTTSASQSLDQGPAVSFSSAVRIPPRSIVTFVSDEQPPLPPRNPPVTDVVWRHSDNIVSLWQMAGPFVAAQIPQPIVPDADWTIQGNGDFDGDHEGDVLWRRDDGTVAIWLMRNGMVHSAQTLPHNPGNDWQIQGTGDFNGDGASDILWRNDQGTVGLWLMQSGGGGTILARPNLLTMPSDWQVQGTGDFNHDGRTDILWRNSYDLVALWLMGPGGAIEASRTLPYPIGSDWQIQGTGDFNADGTSDIVWRNDNGAVGLWLMRDGAVWMRPGPLAITPGTDWQIQGIADFDGDATSDILWRNTSGAVALWVMSGATIAAVQQNSFPAISRSWNVQTLLHSSP